MACACAGSLPVCVVTRLPSILTTDAKPLRARQGGEVWTAVGHGLLEFPSLVFRISSGMHGDRVLPRGVVAYLAADVAHRIDLGAAEHLALTINRSLGAVWGTVSYLQTSRSWTKALAEPTGMRVKMTGDPVARFDQCNQRIECVRPNNLRRRNRRCPWPTMANVVGLGHQRLSLRAICIVQSPRVTDAPHRTSKPAFLFSRCASPRNDAARHFVSGQPLSLAVKNACRPAPPRAACSSPTASSTPRAS